MRIVAARQGWRWLGMGWGLFRRGPMGWLSLVLAYWLLVALLNEIPLAGAIISTLLLPAFSMSFMNACVEAERGTRLSIRMIFNGFQHRLSTLIVLGGLYLMTILMVLGVASLVDGGTLFQWMARGVPPPEASIGDGSVLKALLLASIVAAPSFMAFWFAPALVAWRNMGAAQAMFYSFFAGLRNWRAFAMYGLAVALAGMAMSLIITILAVAVRGNPAVLRSIMLGLTIVLLPTIFASFYYSYRDIFGNDEAGVEVSPHNPGGATHTPPAEP